MRLGREERESYPQKTKAGTRARELGGTAPRIGEFVNRGLVGAEAGFDDEGESGFDAEAGGHERFDPEAMETFGLVLRFGKEKIDGFEFPAALEVFAA